MGKTVAGSNPASKFHATVTSESSPLPLLISRIPNDTWATLCIGPEPESNSLVKVRLAFVLD